MKQSKIVIKDAKRKGGKGYKVATIAKNNEPLQDARGQVFDSPAAVKTHILAMLEAYDSIYGKSNFDSYGRQKIIDLTKDQIFVKKGWAKSGINNKKLV